MNAQSCDSLAEPRRKNDYLLAIFSPLAVICIYQLTCCNYLTLPGQVSDKKPLAKPLVGLPKEEILPINYNQYLATYSFEEPPSELVFIKELLTIAKHNLATLSGMQTYYRRQSTRKLELSDQYNNFTWSEVPLELARGERAVSQPGANLKTNNLFRYIKRAMSKDVLYEIPNLPLDGQDPELITHIDADLRDCTSPIKDQKKCGACYAFSWLSLVEWHYCRQLGTGEKIDFSEQHIIDCGDRVHLKGCEEGKLSDAKDFTQLFGLHLESNFTYTAKKSNTCKLRQGEYKVAVDLKHIQVDREQFEQTLLEQPILVEFKLPSDALSYSSGIHPGRNCDVNMGHGMLLVGHGRQEGRPYWLLRNSMGKRWGENGYFRLARDLPDMNSCFATAFVAKFKFKNLDEDKYIDFYDSLRFVPNKELSTMQNKKRTEADLLALF